MKISSGAINRPADLNWSVEQEIKANREFDDFVDQKRKDSTKEHSPIMEETETTGDPMMDVIKAIAWGYYRTDAGLKRVLTMRKASEMCRQICGDRGVAWHQMKFATDCGKDVPNTPINYTIEVGPFTVTRKTEH